MRAQVNHVEKSALLLPLRWHRSVFIDTVDIFYMTVCLACRCSAVYMGDCSLPLVIHFVKPESVTGAVFFDIESVFLYLPCPRPSLMFAKGIPRKAIPVDAFIADIVDRK
jgi:hypothetical protein